MTMRQIHEHTPSVGTTRRHAVGVAMLCWAGLTAAAAQAPRLPPLVDPPSAEHHVGKFIFSELVTPDLPAAKRFYGGLFGWSFQDMRYGPVSYAEASLDGHPVAELIHKPIRAGEQRQPAWLSLVAVSDADAARTMAVTHGARVLSEPHERSGLGRVAVFADPQGAVFGVLASSSGDPPEMLAAPGEWIWRSLFSRDPDADAAFYQTLFDYEVFDLPRSSEGDAVQHQILASGDYARASSNALQPTWTHTHPHWLAYVRVIDATQAVARAVVLGGRVLLAPRPDRHGGQLAIVADPQGAPVGLLEWPDEQNAKGAP